MMEYPTSENAQKFIGNKEAVRSTRYVISEFCRYFDLQLSDLQFLLEYVAIQPDETGASDKKLEPKPVSIYLGAKCPASRGQGGWGFYALSDNAPYENSGGEDDTTLPRMYLMAAIKAFESLKEPSEVKIFSTDVNLLSDIGGGLARCKAAGWKRVNKDTAKNIDLLELLLAAMQGHKITVQKAGSPTDTQNINLALDCAMMGMAGF